MSQEQRENEVPRELTLSPIEFQRVGDILAQVRLDSLKKYRDPQSEQSDKEWAQSTIEFLHKILVDKFERKLEE